MKRISIFLFVCVLGATTLFAQPTLMPRAGVSISNIALSDELKEFLGDNESSIGFVIGAGVEFPIAGELLALQPELLFHQRGSKLTFDEDGFSQEMTVKLNYLELPVLLKAKFGMFSVYAGPSIAYGIGGSYKSKYSYQGQTFEETGKVKFGDEPDNFEGDDIYVDNALDYNANIGAGVKLGPVIIDLRYVLGLANIQDEDPDFSGDWKFQNRSIMATVVFPIPIGR
jgi:hypothetical protein